MFAEVWSWKLYACITYSQSCYLMNLDAIDLMHLYLNLVTFFSITVGENK